MPKFFLSTLTVTLTFAILACQSTGQKSTNKTTAAFTTDTSLLGTYTQMTFDGPRAGEGYFSADGQWMIFQSEREAANPFYQIYLKDLVSGDTRRISPGHGKTTCSWIAPDKKWFIFSSTHGDPLARKKQKDELDFRNSGQTRRYSWDYDENYEIYRTTGDGKTFVNLTKTLGYDAEGSVSPDGQWIAFASNRAAYKKNISAEDKARLEKDPSFFMDLYIMRADGSQVRQLTDVPGYDGGPFFSPEGTHIVWRRFSPDGHTAEVMTAKIDGSDAKQVTRLNAMSWAPFFHPSGDYIVFTSSVLGHHNFELFIVDRDGKNAPVRITDLPSFDGLPVFTPDGQKLTWNRKLSATESQIVIASWNHERARELLGLPPEAPKPQLMNPEITQADLKKSIQYLASEHMRGRNTGSLEEKTISTALGQYFQKLGLQTAPGVKSYSQDFPFVKNAELGPKNKLTLKHQKEEELLLKSSWQPLSFSKSGTFEASGVVFAGYGIKAPSDDKMLVYDSYQGLDVKDKWVLVFRYSPEEIAADRRVYLQTYSRLEHKAFIARDLGARGIIFVNGPTAQAKGDLVPFQRTSGVEMGLPALTISNVIAAQLLQTVQKDLTTIQKNMDKEIPTPGFELPGLQLKAEIDVKWNESLGYNTLAYLPVKGARHTLVVGAHGDHLGEGQSETSLMSKDDKTNIHYGADDNASGVSAVLELAHYYSEPKNRAGLKQNIIFAIWSGEELGNLGSSHFLRHMLESKSKISSYVNMDMIGRWSKTAGAPRDPLLIQGIGSSTEWKGYVEKLKIQHPIQLQEDPYLPTDAMAFYLQKIPVINFFTGVHREYHTPRDTFEKIDFAGLQDITGIVQSLVSSLTAQDKAISYRAAPKNAQENRRGFRIYLGTIPDYTQEKLAGVKLSGVITGGPAEKAGLKTGDVIVEFSNKKIENLHDYVFTLETIRPNQPTKMVVLRNGQRKEVEIVPVAKE